MIVLSGICAWCQSSQPGSAERRRGKKMACELAKKRKEPQTWNIFDEPIPVFSFPIYKSVGLP
jgi:hypothetical protein